VPLAIAERLAKVLDDDHARWLEKLSISLKRVANFNLSYVAFLSLLSDSLTGK
jgi:hypothetical protein